MRHSIKLPEEFDEFKKNILEESGNEDKPENFVFFNYGFEIIELISSRHFHTPMFSVLLAELNYKD